MVGPPECRCFSVTNFQFASPASGVVLAVGVNDCDDLPNHRLSAARSGFRVQARRRHSFIPGAAIPFPEFSPPVNLVAIRSFAEKPFSSGSAWAAAAALVAAIPVPLLRSTKKT